MLLLGVTNDTQQETRGPCVVQEDFAGPLDHGPGGSLIERERCLSGWFIVWLSYDCCTMFPVNSHSPCFFFASSLYKVVDVQWSLRVALVVCWLLIIVVGSNRFYIVGRSRWSDVFYCYRAHIKIKRSFVVPNIEGAPPNRTPMRLHVFSGAGQLGRAREMQG